MGQGIGMMFVMIHRCMYFWWSKIIVIILMKIWMTWLKYDNNVTFHMQASLYNVITFFPNAMRF